jgi:biotin carboxyl carrier protein
LVARGPVEADGVVRKNLARLTFGTDMATYKVKRQGKEYTVSVSDKADGGSTVTIDGLEFEVELVDGEARLGAPASPPVKFPAPPTSDLKGNGSVVAPISGQVVSILVGVGDSVRAGQVVLKLEAMKMENDIAAPISGIVDEISVNEGSEPKVGQLLMTIV